MHRTLVFIIICAICLISQFTPLSDLMTWDKAQIMSGQWWRLLSGNVIHTNMAHALMNLTALGFICVIFRPSPRRFAILILLLSIMVGAGLIATELHRYVGLSGSLHGLFIYYALQEGLTGRRASWLLVVAVISKIGWEQVFGASPASIALINAPVAIDAHLIGVLAGIILIMVWRVKTNLNLLHHRSNKN